MRSKGSAAELERRRVLAVERVLEGYSTEEVAEFLGVDPSSVRRWLAAFRRRGAQGLVARPTPGRPRKLTRTQEKIALRWLADKPTEHGFDTELWTAARLAEIIRQEWGITLNHQYLTRWLRARDFSPQRPERVPRERDPAAIADWLQSEWERIKKRVAAACPPDFYRRKWAFDGPLGPPDVGTTRAKAGLAAAGQASRKSLDFGGVVVVA